MFVTTPVFDKQWTNVGLDDEDLRQFQNFLLKDPLAGDVIKGTGGARKARVALRDTGKSGGTRVIYYDITHSGILILLVCYPKSKQDNLTNEQAKQVRAVIEQYKGV